MAGKKIQAQLTPEEKLQQALVPTAEQPYKVPANWCWTKLGSISLIKGGKRLPPGKKLNDIKTGYPYIRVTDFDSNSVDVNNIKYIDEETYKILDTYKISINDIYISIAGSIGKVGIIPEILNGAILTENAAKITNIILQNQIYLLYILCSEFCQNQMKESAIATTQSKLALFRIANIKLPLPPLAEQQRIVERIESLFAKLDETKETLQNVLDGFETRKAAILHKAFTGELTAKWRKQHVVSMESWGSVKVSNLCENIVCGKTPTSYIDNNGDIPYLKVYNIVNNKIDFDSKPQYIPKKIHESKLKSSILKPKDVIMNIVGPPLRKIAIIPDTYPEWNMNQAIVRFRTKEKLYYKYLYYYLIYPKTLDDIICETKGVVGQANISITQSRNLNINLPTFSEQTEIVRIIDELFVKEQQAKELAENALSKVDLIKKTILSRAFRGELGTNNPADEPAVELLKRVL